jgi:hypothetical protein
MPQKDMLKQFFKHVDEQIANIKFAVKQRTQELERSQMALFTKASDLRLLLPSQTPAPLIHDAGTDNASFALLFLQHKATINAVSTAGQTPIECQVAAGRAVSKSSSQPSVRLECPSKKLDVYLLLNPIHEHDMFIKRRFPSFPSLGNITFKRLLVLAG